LPVEIANDVRTSCTLSAVPSAVALPLPCHTLPTPRPSPARTGPTTPNVSATPPPFLTKTTPLGPSITMPYHRPSAAVTSSAAFTVPV